VVEGDEEVGAHLEEEHLVAVVERHRVARHFVVAVVVVEEEVVVVEEVDPSCFHKPTTRTHLKGNGNAHQRTPPCSRALLQFSGAGCTLPNARYARARQS
jgi:hypothetical protein